MGHNTSPAATETTVMFFSHATTLTEQGMGAAQGRALQPGISHMVT